MSKMQFGTVEENVVTREEFPLSKAQAVLKNETIAILGYGVQGPAQALNLRDNGFFLQMPPNGYRSVDSGQDLGIQGF